MFVPPGYSPVVDYRIHPSRRPANPSEVVSLVSDRAGERLGNIPASLQYFRNENNVWSHDQFAARVASHHVAINVHKEDARDNLELFRLAPMLSSGMRVVSEPCSPPDEHLMQGLVVFVDREHFPAALAPFLEEARNQTARRAAESDVSEIFRQRFDLTRRLQVALGQLSLNIKQLQLPQQHQLKARC